MPDDGTVRVAGGQGFYGDTPSAVDALLNDGIDYLCLEALAELTLAILQKDRQRDESRGYTRDLPVYLTRALPFVADGKTKVITNAGGINPTAAARAAIATARQLGVRGISIATVVGDDVLTRLSSLHEEHAQPFTHLDTGEPFSVFPAPALFASAYLGARPIVQALNEGADIVITGRVADASLFLAACAHAHGWAWDDWDRLAAGILVGHLLECSGQSLGGNYSGDWWALPHPWDLPYPVAAVDADGSAVISKPAGSGGRVSTDTLRHQLLYEVHDPDRYIAPDVVADFTSAVFEDLPDDRVRVTGVRGRPATGTYKVLLASHAGWAGEARVAFSWPDAYEKAKATAAILMRRVEMAGLAVDEWCVEYWGVNALGGPTVPRREPHDACDPPECVLRVAWRCADQRTAGLVGRELVPLTLSAPPAGMTGAGRGAGSATELLSIWPTLVDKRLVDAEVRVVTEVVT
jgi:Acyclic terpene utilisation family protein AtuA